MCGGDDGDLVPWVSIHRAVDLSDCLGCWLNFYPSLRRTDWKDPDITVGGGQPALFSGVVVAMWVGYALEVSRLGKAKAV